MVGPRSDKERRDSICYPRASQLYAAGLGVLKRRKSRRLLEEQQGWALDIDRQQLIGRDR